MGENRETVARGANDKGEEKITKSIGTACGADGSGCTASFKESCISTKSDNDVKSETPAEGDETTSKKHCFIGSRDPRGEADDNVT